MRFSGNALLCQAFMLIGSMAAPQTLTTTITATCDQTSSSQYIPATSTATITRTSCTSDLTASTVPSAAWSQGASIKTTETEKAVTVTSTYTTSVCAPTGAHSNGTTSLAFATATHVPPYVNATSPTVAPFTGSAAGNLGRSGASVALLSMLLSYAAFTL